MKEVVEFEEDSILEELHPVFNVLLDDDLFYFELNCFAG
jgi:hypothetical protein|tara:strand:- start:31225 stop:31341 length:117 start_codon:yes stop_codon:yes gene_type:complete